MQTTLIICKIFHWTDSLIVLSWVINKDEVYKMYVPQRLIQIKEFISGFEKFKLVLSIIKSCWFGYKSTKELFSSKLWLSSPQFLSLPRNYCPDLHVGENCSNYNMGRLLILSKN